MKKVLLTGANGSVGRHCLPPLVERGFEVHALSRSTIADKFPGVFWHRIDLLDSPRTADLVRLVRPSHLLHLAWITTHGAYWEAVENLDWVKASLDLMDAFAEHGGRRAAFVGSCAEYDWNHGYCRESATPLAPATYYGACKHALQLRVQQWAARFGISTAWARLFFLYGPHEKPERLVPSVIRSLLAGEPARLTEGRQVRDFLHLADAGDALVRILDSELSGPINVASGRPLAVRDLVTRIGELMRRPKLLAFGSLPARPDDPPLLVGDVTRLTNELQWTARFDLDAGLRDTIAWWQANLTGRKQ